MNKKRVSAENVNAKGKCGKLILQLLNTFSSPCFEAKVLNTVTGGGGVFSLFPVGSLEEVSSEQVKKHKLMLCCCADPALGFLLSAYVRNKSISGQCFQKKYEECRTNKRSAVIYLHVDFA
jgi:hypothetical protein